MWQKCPVCAGSGREYNSLDMSTSSPCSVCNGKKIISELSGLPPQGSQLSMEEAEKKKWNNLGQKSEPENLPCDKGFGW